MAQPDDDPHSTHLPAGQIVTLFRYGRGTGVAKHAGGVTRQRGALINLWLKY